MTPDPLAPLTLTPKPGAPADAVGGKTGPLAAPVLAPVITPVEVTVIGTQGTALATPSAPAPLTTGTIATTPDHQPNIVVNVVSPLVAILVRFLNLYLTTLVGLVSAAMTPAGGKLLYTSDFAHMVLVCASLALPGAAIGFGKDLITVFSRLEQSYPLLTGSV
jgi:hypothetical protein